MTARVLLGTTSYGKGVVQTLYPLDGGWMLKLTNAKWYTPSGRSIQREHQPKNDSLPPADTTRPAFRSDNGRVVLGGGGIVPDVVVGADTLTTIEQVVQRALSAKARESNTTLSQMTKELKPKVRYNFTVQPAWRDTLYQRLTRSGVEITRAQYDSSRALIDRLIEQRLSRSAVRRLRGVPALGAGRSAAAQGGRVAGRGQVAAGAAGGGDQGRGLDRSTIPRMTGSGYGPLPVSFVTPNPIQKRPYGTICRSSTCH